MNRARIFDVALVSAVAALFTYLLLFAGPQLDNYSFSADPARRAFHRDLEAAQFCREQHGESSYQWAENGELVCIPRRGKKSVERTF